MAGAMQLTVNGMSVTKQTTPAGSGQSASCSTRDTTRSSFDWTRHCSTVWPSRMALALLGGAL
jgi:hypothetical protein